MELLRQELALLEKILDNTERQIRFFSREHRSLDGLERLLQKRGQLLEQLDEIMRERAQKNPSSSEVARQLRKKIRQLRQDVWAAQQQVLQAAIAEKNNIATKLSGNKMTRNVRNAYIMRWYQEASRGFSCQG